MAHSCKLGPCMSLWVYVLGVLCLIFQYWGLNLGPHVLPLGQVLNRFLDLFYYRALLSPHAVLKLTVVTQVL